MITRATPPIPKELKEQLRLAREKQKEAKRKAWGFYLAEADKVDFMWEWK